MIHWPPYRIRPLDGHRKKKLNLNYIFIFDKFVSAEEPYADWGLGQNTEPKREFWKLQQSTRNIFLSALRAFFSIQEG